MSEFDELISRHGMLMAGRFGPDWRVEETRSRGLFVEFPAALEVMGSFCEAIQSMFNALAVAMGGFSPSTWTPVHGWAASGGIYSIAVHGDRVAGSYRSGSAVIRPEATASTSALWSRSFWSTAANRVMAWSNTSALPR
jgi:roadblock/LC7 domain-containing protein